MEFPMKLSASFLVLSLSALSIVSTPRIGFAETGAPPSITGIWQGFATVRGAQQVPITIRISRSGKKLNAAFLNGPAAHPDETPASSVTWNGSHIVASF